MNLSVDELDVAKKGIINMEYKGKTSHWRKYINSFYQKILMQNIFSILIVIIVYLSNIFFLENKYSNITLFLVVLIIFLLVACIIAKIIHYIRTKDETCLILLPNLRFLTGQQEDSHKRAISLLELEDDSFTLYGIFDNINYFFVVKTFKYENILELSTNFIDYCDVTCEIYNDLNVKEKIKFNLFEMYDIDVEGMNYIYNNYCVNKNY